jgi:hypothetical protein
MAEQRKYISNEELDRLFDEGEEDILQYFDVENARRPGLETRTVAVDLPARVFDVLERESAKTGTPIQDLIEAWIEERAAQVSP